MNADFNLIKTKSGHAGSSNARIYLQGKKCHGSEDKHRLWNQACGSASLCKVTGTKWLHLPGFYIPPSAKDTKMPTLSPSEAEEKKEILCLEIFGCSYKYNELQIMAP